ncbi:MAG: UDP-GlcNAc--UDP-phosphate GlcNAc-1-phosphate transferase [Alistipes sp.]|nr:UDP-GlcNAc--UDP-phosphate GlcNAc-1-phosphate transferase [Alistipes sp.]
MERWIIYTVIFVILFSLQILYFRLADRYNIVDKPNERSSHTTVTLRGGGVIFYIGILLFGFISGFEYPYFIAGLTMIAGVSFIDDIKSVSNRVRLVFHFSAMLLLFAQWGLYSGLDIWYLPVALVICTGIINAFNFMDGINGMTGGYSLAVMLPLIYLNKSYNFTDERLLYVVSLSLLVFCLYNYRAKAKCFAGDVGAVSIAFISMFLIGQLILKTGNLLFVLFLAVYGVDTILTIIRRIILRENIFKAHRKHVYQILANECKIPHVTVSTIYVLLQLAISMGAIFWNASGWIYFSIVVLLLILCYFTVLIICRNKGRLE